MEVMGGIPGVWMYLTTWSHTGLYWLAILTLVVSAAVILFFSAREFLCVIESEEEAADINKIRYEFLILSILALYLLYLLKGG